MATSYDHVNVICPYFHSGTRLTVECEGVNSCSTVTIRFSGKAAREDWKHRYCDCYNYENCIWARMLEEKYAKQVLRKES